MIRNSKTVDSEETHGSGETDRPGRLQQVRSTVSNRNQRGAVTALVGGALLAAAVRSARRSKRRAGALALGGGALLGRSLRQRGSDAGASSTDDDANGGGDDASVGEDTEPAGADDGGDTKSADARANRERADVLGQAETNPRGVSGEPDVETETEPDEGNVQFTTEQEAGEAEPKPRLDGQAKDPRVNGEHDPDVEGDHVEIDLSESAMADEASEATGPTAEQSYPAKEGTDPEPMTDDAPQRYGGGLGPIDGPDAEGSEAGEEDQDAGDESTSNDETGR